MAWAFQLLGIRVQSKECGLSGVEGRGQSTQSWGEKRKKKKRLEHVQKHDLLIILCVCSRCVGRQFAGVA